jgi:serine protease Do
MIINSLGRKVALSVVLAGAAVAQPVAAPAPPELPDVAFAPLAPMLWMGQSGGSYLGVGVADVDDARAKALNLRESRGAELTKVDEQGPAGKAGLKAGDVVLEWNGQRIEGMDQFMRLVRETPAGREVKVGFSRNGSAQTATMTTGSRREAMRSAERIRIDIPALEGRAFQMVMPDTPRAYMSWRSGMLGIEGESLDGQLAEYFGVKDGVLVRSVGRGTAAEKAGVKAGDVITKVDTAAVTSPREITSALRALGEKRTFSVALTRDRKEMSLPVTLEEPQPRPAPAPRARRVNR